MSTVGTEVIEGARVESTAGSPAVAIAKQFNVQPVELSTYKYKFSRLQPITGANQFQIGAGGTQEMLFEIPTKVHNISKSVLTYTKTIADQGANNFAWDFADTLGELYQVQLYARGNQQMLVDVSNANVMLKVMATKELKASEVLEEDSTGLLEACNTPAAQNPTPTAGNGTQTGNINYLEKKFLRVGPVGNGAGAGALARTVQFKLGQFLNTFLAVDKDIVFPEIMVLRLVFMANKAGFLGTSNVDATAGAGNLVNGVPVVGINTCVYLQNTYLYLACEQRPEVIMRVMAQMKSGLTLNIPWTWVYKQPIAGPSISVVQKIDSAQGKFLRKVITAVFPNDESKNAAFDHSNLPAAADITTAGRVLQFHTELDDERLQEYDLTPTIQTATDWIDVKDTLKGSMIRTRHQFYRNWFVYDGWLPESPDSGMKGSDYLGGVDIGSRQRKYGAIFTQMANNAIYNFYQMFVTTRVLRITPTETSVR